MSPRFRVTSTVPKQRLRHIVHSLQRQTLNARGTSWVELQIIYGLGMQANPPKTIGPQVAAGQGMPRPDRRRVYLTSRV